MICKHFLALFLWCHCYQIVLNPILHLIAIGYRSTSVASSNPFGGLYVVGFSITVNASNVRPLSLGQEIVLDCIVAGYPETQFEWYKKRVYSNKENHEEGAKELVQSDDRYIINNNVLTIKSSTIEDVADYFCRVKEPSREVDTENMISVRPKPFIEEFELESSTLRSAIVDDGKTLKITCNVVDDYSSPENITIRWLMSKYDDADMSEVNSGEDGIRLESHNTTSQDLIIDRVTKDHRRLYKCHVSNKITENSKSILIRVRDRYLAAWPAVGIIIELVILVGVICFVENRKVEPDKGAYDRKAIQM